VIRTSASIIAFLLLTIHAGAATYFVSTAGSDTNSGTILSPFATITMAISVAVPGDTMYVRGGTYLLTATISIGSSKSGTAGAWYHLYAYPGDSVRPLLDFSGEPFGSRGIYLRAGYWHIRGFDVRGAGDNGILISGSYNIIEFCTVSENQDTGLQLGGGASNNRIINCDSYFNRDPAQGNADGFSPKLDVGTGNYFFGCRSWQNSDDGWDGYLRPSDSVTTTLENCWSFMNGYLKSGSVSTGNGNGFKMGGGDNTNIDSLRHNMILKKCLAFDNRVKGFDQNNNRGSMTLLNCTGYRNGANNYQISSRIRVTSALTVANSVALGGKVSLASFAVQNTNSWNPPFTVSAADFVSIDTAGVRGPRKPDGSLPDVAFMHLASGSPIIDAGTDVGLPYNGIAPDLGCFETEGVTPVAPGAAWPGSFGLLQNYPNPFNPSTTIRIELPAGALVTLKVYDMLGREVGALLDQAVEAAGTHYVRFAARDIPSGIYLCRMTALARDEGGGGARMYSTVKKMVLAK